MLYETIDMISLAATSISVVFGVITYLRTEYKEKKIRTENSIETLYEMNDRLSKKSIKNDYMDFVHFTRCADRFAHLYNEGQFNKGIVKTRAGDFLVRTYDEKLNKIIAQQRKQFKRDTYFSHLERMINDLKKKMKEKTSDEQF